MPVTQQQQDNLSKALALFIEGFRPYIVSVLSKEAGDRWAAWFVEALHASQRDTWNLGLKNGTPPEVLIDYPHLKSFALKYKDLLRPDFERETNKLATRLETITDVRNKIAHYQPLSEDEYTEAFINFKSISRSLGMNELEDAFNQLQGLGQAQTAQITKQITNYGSDIQPWFKIVRPHLDIQMGRLDESIFAANLGEVALGFGREIYNNPVVFFQKTYITSGLRNIAKRVVNGLNGGQDADNRVISLQTGFGGGKTHTLISLYHLAKLGKKAALSESTRELINATGEPAFDSANIAVFTNSTNDPVQGRQVGDLTIKTLWGELAYQLGGKTAYEHIRENDEMRTAPKGVFKKVLEQCKPCLILIDELADYCISAAAVKVEASNLKDQTISFLQELTEAVSGTDNSVLIATLPASVQELASSANSAEILSALENRIGRIGANMKPVEDDEIFEVVRRRLFEDLGNETDIDAVISEYATLYQSLLTEVPSYASTIAYREKLKKSYPIHPELIDMFRLRWASNPFFQRTRGVLRLLAAIVSDLWKRQNSLSGPQYMIHTSDVVLSNIEAITSQITILNGASWDSVVTADVSGTSSNAFRIDNEVNTLGKYNIAQGISATVLLGTFGSKGQNKGLGIDEIKLCMLKPRGFNHNDINGAIDRMESSAHYLYYSSSGIKRYWFDTTPNVNILINQAKGDVKGQDINAEIYRRINEKLKWVQFFKILVDSSDDITEQMKPALVILSSQYSVNPAEINMSSARTVIENLATKKGNSERIYRNTMLFLVCSEIGIGKLQDDVKNYLACNRINLEYGSQLSSEQKSDIKRRIDEASKQSDISLVTAYSIIAKFSVKNGIETLLIRQFRDSLDNQINYNIISALKEEEWLLESVGLGTLKQNNLFPTLEQAIRVKDIYEAFLRFDDKPMITGPDAISKSLQKYCINGDFCIASGDGVQFGRYYFQETVPFFEPQDPGYWLVDKSLKPQPQPLSAPEVDTPTTSMPSGTNENVINQPIGGTTEVSTVRQLRSISVSGHVPLERYTELFNYFITPFAMSGNKIHIEVSFKITSTDASPIDETRQQYKSAKEAARQLGLKFEEEENK